MIDINLMNFFTIGLIAAIFLWALKWVLAYFKIGAIPTAA